MRFIGSGFRLALGGIFLRRRWRAGRECNGRLRHLPREDQSRQRRIHRTHRHEQRLVRAIRVRHVVKAAVRIRHGIRRIR